MVADNVSQDFGIGLRTEFVAAPQELVPQRRVVLDDAVVDDGQVTRLIDMGVSIRVTRLSMCCPARMTDAERTVNRPLVQQLRQPGYPSDALANLQAPIVEHAKPRRVITAIFQPAQALQKQRGRIFFANVSDDAAHGLVIGYQ